MTDPAKIKLPIHERIVPHTGMGDEVSFHEASVEIIQAYRDFLQDGTLPEPSKPESQAEKDWNLVINIVLAAFVPVAVVFLLLYWVVDRTSDGTLHKSGAGQFLGDIVFYTFIGLCCATIYWIGRGIMLVYHLNGGGAREFWVTEETLGLKLSPPDARRNVPWSRYREFILRDGVMVLFIDEHRHEALPFGQFSGDTQRAIFEILEKHNVDRLNADQPTKAD